MLQPMTDTIAGITVPDSALVKEATELVRDVETDLVYDHSRRTYFFAGIRAEQLGITYDPELLYVGAIFHDLGLTEKYGTTDQRFEIDAANEARSFLLDHGIAEDKAAHVWSAIALHTTPEIPLHMRFIDPVIELVTRGVELDIMGVDYDQLTAEQRDAVTAAHPRPNFKEGIIQAFCNGLKDRPETTFGNVKADVLDECLPGFQRGNFVDEIRGSAWPS